jgi:hypothetical protein
MHAPDDRAVQVRAKIFGRPGGFQLAERGGGLGCGLGGVRCAGSQQQHARAPERFRFLGRFEKKACARDPRTPAAAARSPAASAASAEPSSASASAAGLPDACARSNALRHASRPRAPAPERARARPSTRLAPRRVSRSLASALWSRAWAFARASPKRSCSNTMTSRALTGPAPTACCDRHRRLYGRAWRASGPHLPHWWPCRTNCQWPRRPAASGRTCAAPAASGPGFFERRQTLLRERQRQRRTRRLHGSQGLLKGAARPFVVAFVARGAAQQDQSERRLGAETALAIIGTARLARPASPARCPRSGCGCCPRFTSARASDRFS